MASQTLIQSTGQPPAEPIFPPELPPNQLCHLCEPATLGFITTDELPDLQNVIGQPRALRALELGSEVSGTGYDIFVLGLPGSGRTTLSQEYLKRKAANQAVPDDWCYVNNFDNPYAPKALRLPAGWGIKFRKDVQELVGYLERELPKVFESKEYLQERDKIVDELKKSQEAEFQRLQDYVGTYQFILARTPFGVLLTPGVQGQPLRPEEVEKLTPAQRHKYEQLAEKLGEEVESALNKLREMGREADQKLNELNRQTALFLIEPLIRKLQDQYPSLESAGALQGVENDPRPQAQGIGAYLETLQADLCDNATKFRPSEATEQNLPLEQNWTRRYGVNVLVDNSSGKGAPVIVESHPSYQNLVGRIEHEVVMGATRTDFMMIRPGALQRANGGYLIIPVRDLLINPYAWEGLKRVLRDGEIRIIELGNQLGLISTQSLDPEPIPLELKVLLIGTPLLYYLLRQYDEDFAKLFKVQAEFATLMDRTPETEHEYGLFIKSVLEDLHLPPFDNTAVARVVEFSSRLAEDQRKLSTRFGKIADLVREAAYWGNKEQRQVIDAGAVQRAIEESIYRNNLYEERLQELISQDILMIEVTGAATGQINALSVLALGDYAFGRPCRVSASVYAGQGGVVDIERQAKLGGPIHTKGVLILTGFLGGRYGRGRPLSLSASLTFEQSYDEVEGDSASAAELLALLSAIAQVPIRQSCAITGSVNQHGQIQAIGGINEKIEGFYAVCKAKGLTGEQGVIIPAANRCHLMLNREVVEAVAAGKFHLWPVTTIDDCLAVLTGCEPGTLREDGSFPEGTFNAAVAAQLEAFAQLAKAVANGNSHGGSPEENGASYAI